MANKKNILLIASNANQRLLLSKQLASIRELIVFEASSGSGAIDCLRYKDFDLIIIDMDAADVDAHNLYRTFRRYRVTCPIIKLIDKEQSLEPSSGAAYDQENCLVKPITGQELLRCVMTHLRGYKKVDDNIHRIGPYRFHPADKTLRRNEDEQIQLTSKESQLLKFLCRASGQSIERDVLLQEVWGYHPGISTHTVETHIYRLRKKLEPDQNNKQYLLFDKGGYRLSLS